MLYSNPLPIESSWSSQEKIDVVLYFLESFLHSIIKSFEPQMSSPLNITTAFKGILLGRYEEDNDLSSLDYHLQEKLTDMELNRKVVTYANQQAKLLHEQLYKIVFEGPRPQDYIKNEMIIIYENLFANEDSFRDYVSLVAIKSADYIEEVLRFVVGLDSTIKHSELSQVITLFLRIIFFSIKLVYLIDPKYSVTLFKIIKIFSSVKLIDIHQIKLHKIKLKSNMNITKQWKKL